MPPLCRMCKDNDTRLDIPLTNRHPAIGDGLIMHIPGAMSIQIISKNVSSYLCIFTFDLCSRAAKKCASVKMNVVAFYNNSACLDLLGGN